jgi:hypothetical protein
MKTHLRHRQIDYYDKITDKIIGEIDIESFDLDMIKKRFSIHKDDPFVFNPYLIDLSNVDLFPNVKFDFKRYDYYLACYSDYSIRTNKNMDLYLEKLGYDFGDNKINLPIDLEKIVSSNFLTTNDCVTLKGFGHKINPRFDTAFEKCDWEYNETHFHPDSFAKGDDEIEYLKLALECGKRLSRRLAKRFKNDNFRIQISFMESQWINGEIDNYGSSTVRFYKIRPEAESGIYVDNLDIYKVGAVLELEKR